MRWKRNTMLALLAVSGWIFLGFFHMQANPQNPAFRKLQQFKKLQLIEYLDLDDKVAEKFFVVYNRSQKQVEAQRRKIRQLTARLNEAMRLHDTEMVKKYNSELVQAHRELNRTIEQSLTEIRRVLGEEKFAKFLIFESRFRDAIKKFRERRKSRRLPR